MGVGLAGGRCDEVGVRAFDLQFPTNLFGLIPSAPRPTGAHEPGWTLQGIGYYRRRYDDRT
jgi:hypothetical protein